MVNQFGKPIEYLFKMVKKEEKKIAIIVRILVFILCITSSQSCSKDKVSTLDETTIIEDEIVVSIDTSNTNTTNNTGNSNANGAIAGVFIPADLMINCNQWKITYPDGVEDKTLCSEGNNEYFFINEAKTGIVFKAPIRSTNNTTTNSTYIRSELRERTADGLADIYWTTAGKHVIYVQQAFTHLPINKKHIVGTQIHGDKAAGIDDAMVLRLEGAHLFLSFNGGKLRSDVTIKTDYVLGTSHEVIFEIVDGKHYCYYSEDGNLKVSYESGNASSYLVNDGSNAILMNLNYNQSYFKVGNYTQSNSEKEGADTDNVNNYGEVIVFDFFAKHQ